MLSKRLRQTPFGVYALRPLQGAKGGAPEAVQTATPFGAPEGVRATSPSPRFDRRRAPLREEKHRAAHLGGPVSCALRRQTLRLVELTFDDVLR